MRCRHEAILDASALASFDVKPNTPIAAFVQRLRCTNCGSASVMANRIFETEARARRAKRAS
jgi:hypothetical protein